MLFSFNAFQSGTIVSTIKLLVPATHPLAPRAYASEILESEPIRTFRFVSLAASRYPLRF